MRIVSVREEPQYANDAIQYIQAKWANEANYLVYDDCIRASLSTKSRLPQWYIMLEDENIIGCAGLITNDFVSRMDLCPWICSLFIEESCRNKGMGQALIEHIIGAAKALGFTAVHLCTDHIGYYEQYGFSYIGDAYHPWGEQSRVYTLTL